MDSESLTSKPLTAAGVAVAAFAFRVLGADVVHHARIELVLVDGEDDGELVVATHGGSAQRVRGVISDECHLTSGFGFRCQTRSTKGLGSGVVVKAGARDGYLFATAAVIRAQRNLGLGLQFWHRRWFWHWSSPLFSICFTGPVIGASDDGESVIVVTAFAGVLDASSLLSRP